MKVSVHLFPVLEFTASASSWFDPASWNSTDFQTANDTRRFMLDLEQVPCGNDKVVFPAEHSFQVDMSSQSLKAASVNIRNQACHFVVLELNTIHYTSTEQQHSDFTTIHQEIVGLITTTALYPKPPARCGQSSYRALDVVILHVHHVSTYMCICSLPILLEVSVSELFILSIISAELLFSL